MRRVAIRAPSGTPRLLAVTREVSPAFARCELTHLPREPIDVERAVEQHGRYEDRLSDLGCTILRLPAEPDLADSVFVEDAAVVLDEIAILTRPGAASRRKEVDSIAKALAPYRELVAITAPATLDGGDVLRIDKSVYVGISSRTNAQGFEQLRAALEPRGYTLLGIPVTSCLHLKSAVTQVAEKTVLLHPDWVRPDAFTALERVVVDPSEPHAANALLVGDAVIYPSIYPRTRERLERKGIRTVEVDVTELIKAEGAVTCCSIVIRGT